MKRLKNLQIIYKKLQKIDENLNLQIIYKNNYRDFMKKIIINYMKVNEKFKY